MNGPPEFFASVERTTQKHGGLGRQFDGRRCRVGSVSEGGVQPASRAERLVPRSQRESRLAGSTSATLFGAPIRTGGQRE